MRVCAYVCVCMFVNMYAYVRTYVCVQMFICRVSLRVNLPQLPMQCACHRKRVLLNDKFLRMWKNVSQPLNFKELFQHSQEGTALGCICSHMKPHCEQERQYCLPCSNPTLQSFWDR